MLRRYVVATHRGCLAAAHPMEADKNERGPDNIMAANLFTSNSPKYCHVQVLPYSDGSETFNCLCTTWRYTRKYAPDLVDLGCWYIALTRLAFKLILAHLDCDWSLGTFGRRESNAVIQGSEITRLVLSALYQSTRICPASIAYLRL